MSKADDDMTAARDPIEAAHVLPGSIKAACAGWLNAEFDEMQPAWFQPRERAAYVHNRMAAIEPLMRSAVSAYLRAEAVRRRATEGGEWCEVLAAEVAREQGGGA